MSYCFDAISDIHLDFYISPHKSEQKMVTLLNNFIQEILPANPQEVLVIAGDLGHYNYQNYRFLLELRNYYQHIILVAGNHDFYLVTGKVRSRYQMDSRKRLQNMKDLAVSIPNVHYLDGDTIEINHVVYGGTSMWYDFEYSIQNFGMDKETMYEIWQATMNDGIYIKRLGSFYLLDYYMEQKEKLGSILGKSDVIVTHVGPDWSQVEPQHEPDHIHSFYYFDGACYFPYIENKVWVYGHHHTRVDYINHGCRFINAALGYPEESKGRRIKNILFSDKNSNQ